MDVDAHRVIRGDDGDRPLADRVPAAALPAAQPGTGAVEGADPRPRLAVRLRRRRLGRRDLHQLPPQEGRPRRAAPDPHGSRASATRSASPSRPRRGHDDQGAADARGRHAARRPHGVLGRHHRALDPRLDDRLRSTTACDAIRDRPPPPRASRPGRRRQRRARTATATSPSSCTPRGVVSSMPAPAGFADDDPKSGPPDLPDDPERGVRRDHRATASSRCRPPTGASTTACSCSGPRQQREGHRAVAHRRSTTRCRR